MKVVASAIVDKYIGESARVIREMFGEAFQFIVFLRSWVLYNASRGPELLQGDDHFHKLPNI